MADSKLQGKKILWIEDDQFLSGIVAQKLTSRGAILSHASSGEDGYALLKKEAPDLILLDLLLPAMTGFEVLERIHDDEVLSKVPVIVFSNLGEPADMKRVKDLGAYKFLIKSTMVPDELVGELEAAL